MITDQDRRLTELLKGSIALARMPSMEADLERLKLENQLLRNSLEASLELLTAINECLPIPMIAASAGVFREVLEALK